MDYVFLIEKGNVIVKDYFNEKPLFALKPGDFFGDYQVLLETRSNLTFEAAKNDEVILFGINKKLFLEVTFEI